MAVDKKELVRLQEDSTLQKFKKAKRTETRKEYEISDEKRGGIWYQIRQRKNEVVDTQNQILVPKSLRKKVIKEAYDSLFGGHLGAKKTEDRIQANFFFGQNYTMMLPVFTNRVTFVRKLCP